LKIPHYFLNEKNLEDSLKSTITNKSAYEIALCGAGTIYQLKVIHGVPKEIIRIAQAQILLGLVMCLTPAAPIAGVFISEGMSDIIMALIDQGKEKYSRKSFLVNKLTGYLTSFATLGLSTLFSSSAFLKKAISASRKLIDKLKNAKYFKKICQFLAKRL
jgi:hypothetical protein